MVAFPEIRMYGKRGSKLELKKRVTYYDVIFRVNNSNYFYVANNTKSITRDDLMV